LLEKKKILENIDLTTFSFFSFFLYRDEPRREGGAASFHPELEGGRVLQNQLHLLRHCLRLLPLE
jgi:hypothetical protein